MKIEQAKKHIMDIICENNTISHSDMIVFKEEKEALRTAIKSLDMWDKVIEDIGELNDRMGWINAEDVIDIIEKYKKEIEE